MSQPQNEIQYLLDCAIEECAEIIQRITKAKRFTLEEIQPGTDHGLNNAERIVQEYADLVAVMERLEGLGALSLKNVNRYISAKNERLEHYMKYSEERGTLKR
jgi:hypothetical protein